MTFDTYRNWEHNEFSSSMDVHDNLIAASTDDMQVQLFNGNTGREMQIGPRSAFENFRNHAVCVRFTQNEYANHFSPIQPCFRGWALNTHEL